MIIPGMVSATFRNKPAEDILGICREAKLKAVEWSENAHVQPGDKEGAADLYERTVNAGLRVAAYGSYYRLGRNEEPDKALRASLDSAKALHSPLIRIWAGEEASDRMTEEKRRTLTREASRAGKIAAEYGIKAAFEWHKNTLTDTNESAMKLLCEASQDNLYCLWQPTVALSMEQRTEGLDLLRQNKRLLNLHIYYWLDGVRRPLAEGEREWMQYLEHVDPVDERFGLLEFVMGNTEQQFLEDAAVLCRWLGR